MPNIVITPSTLDGIKRLAKSIKRDRVIPHHEALELAAQAAGFQNLRHAKNTLVNPTGSTLHAIYLTAYWTDDAGAGRETLRLQLAKPLGHIVTRHQLRAVRQLGAFKMESEDHLEAAVDLEDRAHAHDALLAAARTLRFMEATGLVPATTRRQERPMRVFENLPGRDHRSYWIDAETGAWVFMDEPYPHVDERARAVLAEGQRLAMLRSSWPGIYNPGGCTPYLFSSEQALIDRLSHALAQLNKAGSDLRFDGESARYGSRFVSPARAMSGKPARARPMPAPPGFEYRGALPYGSRSGGKASKWRPAQRMTLECHLKLGALLGALEASKLPRGASAAIMYLRVTLDDWVQMEYPGDEMTDEQFRQMYYGPQRHAIAERVSQLRAVQETASLIREGYEECAPKRRLMRKLAGAESALCR